MTRLFLLLLGTAMTYAQILREITTIDCDSCCEDVVASGFLGSEFFNVDVCKEKGCRRLGGVGERCENLFPSAALSFAEFDADRRACEVGRDLFFSGFSKVIDANDVLTCTGGSLGFNEELDDLLFNTFNFELSVDACKTCCDNIDADFDNGDLNDFRKVACEGGCETDIRFFESLEHRDRAGFTLGLDVYINGETEFFGAKLECDETGELAAPVSNNNDGPNLAVIIPLLAVIFVVVGIFLYVSFQRRKRLEMENRQKNITILDMTEVGRQEEGVLSYQEPVEFEQEIRPTSLFGLAKSRMFNFKSTPSLNTSRAFARTVQPSGSSDITHLMRGETAGDSEGRRTDDVPGPTLLPPPEPQQQIRPPDDTTMVSMSILKPSNDGKTRKKRRRRKSKQSLEQL